MVTIIKTIYQATDGSDPPLIIITDLPLDHPLVLFARLIMIFQQGAGNFAVKRHHTNAEAY